MLLVVCAVNCDRQEGSMNPARIPGALYNKACGALRQVCLRQAQRLGCNPLGIIAGLAVMVGAIELWDHASDAAMWIFVLAGPAVIVVITLVMVRLLARMAVVSWPGREQRPAGVGQSAGVLRPQPGPRPQQRRMRDRQAGEGAEVPADSGTVVRHPDSAECLAEPERIPERV
jgi:hypothetical protein